MKRKGVHLNIIAVNDSGFMASTNPYRRDKSRLYRATPPESVQKGMIYGAAPTALDYVKHSYPCAYESVQKCCFYSVAPTALDL